MWNRADYNDDAVPFSGTLQFEPLRQVLDGRVKRRLRRHRLSEEINSIELDKRYESRARKSEVDRLKEELAAKDVEVQNMREEYEVASQIGGEAGLVDVNQGLSGKVMELEREIRELKGELERREGGEEGDQTMNWTLNARDPFNFVDDDDADENMITNYDEDFGESMLDDEEMISTPTRLNTSFPSPPSTMPNTPCRADLGLDAGIQVSLPASDAEKDMLKQQLRSLEEDIGKLNESIAFRDDHQDRLTEKLGEYLPLDEEHDHTTLDAALDKVLTQLALSQSQGIENTHAFSALTSEIANLGFPVTGGADAALEAIGKQFRQARLDLEYLTPGEVVEGFENHKLLEMLISRIRVLVENVKQQDDSIDQYHEQELLLRQQLGARVSAMDSMKEELFLANEVVGDLREEVEEKETSNERLQSALNGYRDEVSSLESLIERIENESREIEGQLRSEIEEAQERLQDEVLKHDVTRADNEGKDILLVELERRLSTALRSMVELESKLTTLSACSKGHAATVTQLTNALNDRERIHGAAVSLRDARVSELRHEIERVNDTLKTAQSTILDLRNSNQTLQGQIQGEKTRGLFVVKAMKDQLTRALEAGTGYVNGDVSVAGSEDEDASARPVVRRGRFMDARLARKGGKKLRRRYDSGLGFLEEEDDQDEVASRRESGIEISTDIEDAVDAVC